MNWGRRRSDSWDVESTPTIPGWIRGFRSEAYTNIYELCPRETRLYGTESLFGDWSAPVLLLAKDFAPRRIVTDRIAAGDPRPFRHEPTMKTNQMLVRYAAPLGQRLLYGSALVGLLRNDGAISGTLPARAEVMPWATRVLRFTMEHMPNLRAIVCLGTDAWDCARDALELRRCDRRELRRIGRPAISGGVMVFPLPHPSRTPGGRVRVEQGWADMARALAA